MSFTETPMVHQCCGREVCIPESCPNHGPWYKTTKWRMDGYYFSFDKTGVAEIDKILSAIACAGKAFHATEDWNEDCSPAEHLEGNTPIEWIQNAANKAAETIKQGEIT